MKYYYNIDNANHGPVSMEELAALAEKGVIQAQTPVIEVGKSAWSRWGVVAAEQAAKVKTTGASALKLKLPATSVLKPVKTPLIGASPAMVSEEPDGSFAGKIHSLYQKIDDALETKGAEAQTTDTLSAFKKKFSLPAAITGVAVFVCYLVLGLANAMHKCFPLLISLMVIGCFVQYICYQMYNSMTPLLFGKKIKFSSLGILRALALVCVLPALMQLKEVIEILAQDGNFKWSNYVLLLAPHLSCLFLYAGMSYAFINAKRFFVVIEPHNVSSGREFINLLRVVLRAMFSALHALTPALILLAVILIVAKGNPDLGYADKLSENFEVLDNLMESMPSFSLLFLNIKWPLLPIYSLIGYYILSLIPDLLDSVLSIGEREK